MIGSSLAAFYARRWAACALCILLLLVPALTTIQVASAAEAEKAQPRAEQTQGEVPNQQSGRAGASGDKSSDGPGNGQPANTTADNADKSEEQASPTRRLAQTTADLAASLGATVTDVWQTVTATGAAGERGPRFNATAFFQAVYQLALVIGVAFVVLFVLRRLIRRLLAITDRFAATESSTATTAFLRRAGAILVAGVADVIGVLLAAAAAAAAAAYVVDADSVAATRASLFVNAFVLVELIKVGVRSVFSSSYSALRPVPVNGSLAAWWSVRLRWLIGGVAYSTLVAVPILENQLSARLGALLYFATMLVALVFAIRALAGHRRILSGRLIAKADAATSPIFAFLFRLAARLWLPLAGAYLVVLFVLSQLHSSAALIFFAYASLKTVIAGLVAGVVCRLITAARVAPSRLPTTVKQELPQLEGQLNRYVPVLSIAAKVLVLFLLAGTIIGIWHVINFDAWLHSPTGANALGAAVRVLLVLVVAIALWILASSIIEFRLSPNTGNGAPTARQQTLMALFRNALAIVIVTLTAMIALSQVGVNIGPLIASAGILGLAIGFGAQNLVQDVIAGVFIQLENSMNAGDVVTAGGVTGTVERLTIRSAAIRDLDGTLHVVPFSEARVVSNYMREWASSRCEYRIAYGEDIDSAISCLFEAFEDLKTDPEIGPNLLGELTVPGVCEIEQSAVRLRAMIDTVPGMQWAVNRAFNRVVKIHFDRAGIEIPFPHQTLYFGDNSRFNPKSIEFIEPPVPGQRGALDASSADSG